jgi:hypothetical protein
MNNEKIKQQVETNQSFQYWNKAIGLSFDDFSVYEFMSNDKVIVLKNGNKTIGNYSIYLKNGVIDSFCFDMNNETVRKHTLEILKAS